MFAKRDIISEQKLISTRGNELPWFFSLELIQYMERFCIEFLQVLTGVAHQVFLRITHPACENYLLISSRKIQDFATRSADPLLSRESKATFLSAPFTSCSFLFIQQPSVLVLKCKVSKKCLVESGPDQRIVLGSVKKMVHRPCIWQLSPPSRRRIRSSNKKETASHTTCRISLLRVSKTAFLFTSLSCLSLSCLNHLP